MVTESNQQLPKKKKRRLLRLIVLLACLALFVVTAVFLIRDFTSGDSRILGFLSPRVTDITTDEFNFSVGRDRVFAYIEDSVVSAGTLGVQVLDTGGRETLRDSFRLARPAIVSSKDRCVAFDIGGSAVRVISSSQILSSIEVTGAVVSASINQNGWFCIVTQEGGGLKGSVTVYNRSGEVVFRVNLGSGYILTAELSPDNKNLAILNLTDFGSRISFYNNIAVEKDEVDHQFDLRDELLIDIKYVSNKDVLAISTDSLYVANINEGSEVLYGFSDKRLGGYTFDGDFIAILIYDHGIGYQGRIVTLLESGTLLGDMTSEREILSMSSVNNILVILRNDGIAFYNEVLDEFPVSGGNASAAGASRALAISQDVALATTDNSAIVIRLEEES